MNHIKNNSKNILNTDIELYKQNILKYLISDLKKYIIDAFFNYLIVCSIFIFLVLTILFINIFLLLQISNNLKKININQYK